PPFEEPREASAPREPLALDELRALIAQIRGEQHAALAETNAATAAARAIAEKALGRVDTVAADDPGVALEHVAAAVASLRDQVAALQRRQEEHAVAAANASAEATSARETAAEALRRIEEVGRPRAEVASVEAAVARLSADLDGLRSTVEEAAASRPIEDPAAPAEGLRARLDELARAQDGDRELASRAAADAARAMRQAEKAILRIADAIDPVGDELRALRTGFGELRAAQTRHEAAVERRLDGAETRTESSLTSLSERIDHLGHKLDAQEMAGENTRVEAALTRQRAAEALHGVEALESLRVELAALESRVEEQIEASIRMETARLATETGLRDRLEAEAQGLREGFETLAARLREVTGETRWLPTVNQLFDRLATLTEVPSRALTRLVALLGW
ncbi:MAG TPA: hypothetical protein VEM57_02585, partial [Candidatus Binatus sp.]|nr:hypothetical protein [Candidatus Binatus sp.]